MILDCNCWLGDWPFRKLPQTTAAELVELLDGYGVTQAFVGHFAGVFYRDMAAANDLLLEAVSGHEDRLLPWAAINPAFPGWEDDLQEAAAGGFAGVRLYPNYHGYELGDECLRDLLGAARALRWPVAIYPKLQDERLHHWRMPVPATDLSALPELVAAFPDLPLIIMGQGVPFAQQFQSLFAGSRLLMDLSRCEGIGGVADLVRTIGAEHVLFGSHAPFFYLEAAVLKLQEAGLPDNDRDAILHRNAVRLLPG